MHVKNTAVSLPGGQSNTGAPGVGSLAREVSCARSERVRRH